VGHHTLKCQVLFVCQVAGNVTYWQVGSNQLTQTRCQVPGATTTVPFTSATLRVDLVSQHQLKDATPAPIFHPPPYPTLPQMISLMDNLLKRENLDLRLTPYRVLPTGSDDGLVEFVPSAPLSRILSEHRTIHKFLAQTQADLTGTYMRGGGGGGRQRDTTGRGVAGWPLLLPLWWRAARRLERQA
jgi:hypothetical protein